ncbi:MAG TPA: Gfo/Idh/MocA family oxidoreductase [Candidatus Acidoferrales bacterium]|nr:Gfo/Idh/MocA family oxidoreductase [Candidatus Acidoferrales bacterium]
MTTNKVRWGVLGVASIALRRAIPGMQKGEWSEVAAIASRDLRKASDAASKLGIAKAYGSYDDLLADSNIEAIYNPLPNQLHVPWSIRAAEAGKHVLCEKPLSITVAEARQLLAARDRAGVKIGEAFMVRTHPRWLRVRELVRAGRIGQLRAIACHFSYFNRDPTDICNLPECGGGALLDIGCYPITLSRFIFGEEPSRVIGLIERDRDMKTDRLTSALLDFPSGQPTFTCSTQLAYRQSMQLTGTQGRIEIEYPINPPADQPSRILIEDGKRPPATGVVTETIDACDQFTIQGDAFSRAIRECGEVPVSVEDAIGNIAVIEALFRSAESGKWERPEASVRLPSTLG